jgi:regulator of sigma E protease
VVSVDGLPVGLWLDFVAKVRESAGKSLRLEILRDEAELLEVRPDAVEERGRTVGKIGVAVMDMPGGRRVVPRSS